ncbi:MAG: molecular chaperone TorD family protein [Thermodesulfovibrionales bacterium]
MSKNTLSVEKSEIAKGRSYVYHLLAMLYLQEITAETLTILRNKEVVDTLAGLGLDVNYISPDVPQERLLNDLAEEYAALFVVSGGIPPYESARLKGLLCQEPASEVEEFYRRCGLVVKEDCGIIPDHLGMEMEFMGYLASRESDAWKAGDEKTAIEWSDRQREFFASHINNWVFDFLKDLERLALHPFYRDMGRLTQRFLETEQGYLESKNPMVEDEKWV